MPVAKVRCKSRMVARLFLYIYHKEMIRKTILLFITLLAAFSAQAADKLLVVETTDGGKIYFALSESPELTFSGQTMLITTTTRSQDFEIADVAQYYFSGETTGTKALKANELRISQSGDGQVTIEGLHPSSVVRLYSLDGKEQPASVTYADGGKATVSLSSLPKGTYIISANKQQTIKINKR